MISFRRSKLSLLLFLGVSTLTFTTSQTEDSDTEAYTKLPTVHPIRAIFTPEEFRTIRTAPAVTITPLKFEEKSFAAYMEGRNDAMKDLMKNVTPEDGRIRVEAILKKNEENKFTLTPEQVKENLIRAYQLGGLHAINEVRQTAKKSLPSIRSATSDELKRMRIEHRAMIRAIRELGGDHTLEKLSEHYESEEEEEELNGIDNINEFEIDQRGRERRRRCPRRLNRRLCRRRQYRHCPRCREFEEDRDGGYEEEEINANSEAATADDINLNAIKSSNDAESKLDSLFDVHQFGWRFGHRRFGHPGFGWRFGHPGFGFGGYGWGWHRPFFGWRFPFFHGWGYRRFWW